MSTLNLGKLLNPASIVVIGASARESSPGHKLTRNLLQGEYKGTLFLVNPRYPSVLDQPCYKSVKVLPDTPELALIITPARLLRRYLVQSARKGIKVAVVMSGIDNSHALHRYARRLGLRLLGPYCAGLIRPHIGLNATYSVNAIEKGSLAIVSQSASLAAAMLDWAQSSGVGFSAVLSTGPDTDVTLADLLDLLTEDWQTKAVIVYLDSVNGIRGFLSALSATARIKPVVLMRSAQEGARYCDALARTGEVYSSNDVFDAALNRTGVVRIRSFSNLFAAAKILSSRIRVHGNRLAIIGNGSAPAMLAHEQIEMKGFQTPELAATPLNRLHKMLGKGPAGGPAGGSAGAFTGTNPFILRNPVLLAEHYQQVIGALQETDEVDAILVIFVPDSRNDPDLIAAAIAQCVPSGKPLLTCWMGDASVIKAREILADAGLPTFRTPEAATNGFDFLYRYHVSQQQLLQLPNPAARDTRADAGAASTLVRQALEAGQRVLGAQETRRLMKLFDIPVLPSSQASSLQQALDIASQIGYPVVMKLLSPNISYKASVIRTQMDIKNPEGVTAAWQKIDQQLRERRPDALFRGVLVEAMYCAENYRHLAVAITREPKFGPVLSVSVGGELTALVNKRSVQLPPLNRFLIHEMLKKREIQTYMGAFRHSTAIDDGPVMHTLRRLSELASEIPEVFSLDINPLAISEHGAVAIDVQVVLEKSHHHKRYAQLAIHPYPWQWVRKVTLHNHTEVELRPIRPEDGEWIKTLVRKMSAESRYFRFMHAINELSPQMVAQFTKLDYDRQMAFVATVIDQGVVGVSRYIISNDRRSGEFAISVSDSWKGQGLATALMQLLIEHATEQGLERLQGDVLRTNVPMQALMKALGFTGKVNPDQTEVTTYRFDLRGSA